MRLIASLKLIVVIGLFLLCLGTGCEKKPNASMLMSGSIETYPLHDPAVNIVSVVIMPKTNGRSIKTSPTYVFIRVEKQFSRHVTNFFENGLPTVSIDGKILDLRKINPGIYIYNRQGRVEQVVLAEDEKQHIMEYYNDSPDANKHYGYLKHDSIWLDRIQEPLLDSWIDESEKN